MTTVPATGALAMTPDMFSADYKSKMIAAYPVIAQMDADEFYFGTTDEHETAFARILAARNLRQTHELYLTGRRCF